MAKNKITFSEGTIFVNGAVVGRITRGPEVWVTFYRDYNDKTKRDEFVARFKYFKSGLKARHFVKWALKNFTPAQVIDGCKANQSPLGWAESNGYVSYMKEKYPEGFLQKPA